MTFRVLPYQGGTPREISEIVNNIMNGKTNNTGTVTLATGNALTTTLYDERISPETKIILIPFSAAAFADSAPYGQFTNNNDQSAPSAGSSAVVEFDTTEFSNGVYLADDTKIYVRNAGIYNVQFSLQLANYDNAPHYADVWFRLNNTDVPRSASRFYVPARKSAGVPSHVIGTVNTFIDMDAGQYVEIAGYVSDTDVVLEHYPADGAIPRPAIPAVILTVQYVAPMAYSNIYVSSQTFGSATITHYANSTADKTYAYVLVG
jgi:molybdopterin-binding protein